MKDNTLKIVADWPKPYQRDSRIVSLKVAGVSVFSELVYDTREDGTRSEEQAIKNFASILGSKLRRVLEDEY